MSLLVLLSLFFSIPPSIPATRHTRLEAMLLLPHVLLWLVSFSLFVLLYSTFCFLFLSIISDVDWLFLAGQRRRQLSIGARAHTKAADGLRRGSPFIMTGGHQIAFSSSFVLFFLFFFFWLDETAPGSSCQPNRESSISLLFFVFLLRLFCCCCCCLSCVYCVQSPGAITPGAAIVTNVDDVVGA